MKISITVGIKLIRKLAILLFWLILWELCSLLTNNSILLPSPLEVVKSLCFLSGKLYFWNSVLDSLARVICGISISVAGGILFGMLAGLNKFVEEFLYPLIVTLKATPVMSIIILALVWFNSNNVVIFTAILICFPIIYTNILEGIRSADKKILEMAHIYKVKKIYILKDVYLPQIKSYIVSGILMCMGIGWKVSVASEVLSTPKYSIGINLMDAKTMLETSELFAWTIVVIFLSFIFEEVFKICLKGIHTGD